MTYKFLVIVTIPVWALLAACKNTPREEQQMVEDAYYTCSMHPQVMQEKPGNCPICHMELIKVKKTHTADDEIRLNDEQIRLGNIHTDTVHNGTIGNKIILTATLNADEMKVTSINVRITGRIDRLYYKSAGDYVPKGAHLYDLYSEELNNAKQEYLAALERKHSLDNSIIDFDRLINSAKTKLQLWGMSDAQIKELEISGKSSPLTAFYSNVSGYITEMPVTEGQYVTEGETILKLANLSYLWAEAQLYASQWPAANNTGGVMVEFPDLPGKKIRGKIALVNPEIEPGTRVNLLRISIPNPSGLLKPGMPAYVMLESKPVTSLTLPTDAVVRNGKINIVWVQSRKNTFKMKIVETGLESGGRIEIKSGISVGDIVVTGGAYLLNSEYIFQKGNNGMAGMQM